MRRVVWSTVFLAFATIHVVALPYYSLSVAGRVRHPLHVWFKPSGYVGQTAGILAALLFLFMWLYSLRKRVRWLAFAGTLGSWLDVHIFVGLVLPLLGAVHAAWRFEGVIGLGYAAMLGVSASGVAGRYLYVRIPRARSGLELTGDETRRQRDALTEQLSQTLGNTKVDVHGLVQGLDPGTADVGKGSVVLAMVRDDLARRRAVRTFRRQLKNADRATVRQACRLARRQLALRQQTRMLDATHRLFRYWHVAHKPIAITALLALTVHIAVVVTMGVTWLW